MNSRGNRHHNSNNSVRGGRNSAARPSHSPSQNAPQPHSYAPVLSPKDQADLDVFRNALKELTFNSRPIIEKLTGMARERARTIPGPVSRTILDNLVFVTDKIFLH